MNILVLGQKNQELESIITKDGHRVVQKESSIDVAFLEKNHIDFVISYGYRYIIQDDVLSFMKGRIINMHISYLPWNRGAYPNLWSFLEDTPKGVTIHYIDEGIDTGDIIAQRELFFEPDRHTLITTYSLLHKEMIALFKETWPLIDVRGGAPLDRDNPRAALTIASRTNATSNGSSPEGGRWL
jgi:methionyl-tRNA formyltransferase